MPPLQTIAEMLQHFPSKPPHDITGKQLSPRPLSPDALTALSARRDVPVPAELLDWLRFDASWFPRDDSGHLRIEPLRQLFTRWADETANDDDRSPGDSGPIEWTSAQAVEAWIDLLPSPSLAGAPAIELTYTPGSQEHLLILEPSRARVLGCERRFELWWKYDSLTELLNHWLKLP